MGIPINPHAMIPTGIVAPHPTPAISSTGATHRLELVLLQQLLPHHTGISAHESQTMPKTLNPNKPHHPKTVTIQDSPSDSSSDSDSDSDHLNY